MVSPTVHQCPFCELRFANRGELADHVAVEHPSPTDHDLPPHRRARGVVTVPLDPARPPGPALPAAVALAQPAGLAVELVAAPSPGLPATTAGYLAAHQRDLRAAGVVALPPHELAGDPAEAVVAHAAEGTSLLCLATRARGRIAEPLFGSVSARIARTSTVPVLLVGPAVHRPGTPLRRVVGGIDDSSTAAEVCRAATHLAERLGLPFELVRVVEPGAPAGDPETADATGPAGEGECEPVVIHDRDPARALAGRAGTGGDTIVVVGSHRAGRDRRAPGSVATGLARHASGPVLVVPPGTHLDLDRPIVAIRDAAPPVGGQATAGGPPPARGRGGQAPA